MTTLAPAYPNQNKSHFWLLAIFLVAAILGIHALIQHGTDAELVRQSMCKNGSFLHFTERDGCTCHWLTRMDDGRIGDQITTVNQFDHQTYEVTSFIPKGGVLGNILKWLDRKNCTRQK